MVTENTTDVGFNQDPLVAPESEETGFSPDPITDNKEPAPVVNARHLAVKLATVEKELVS